MTQSSFPFHASSEQPFVLTSDIFYVSASPAFVYPPPFPICFPSTAQTLCFWSALVTGVLRTALEHCSCNQQRCEPSPSSRFPGINSAVHTEVSKPREMLSNTQTDPAGLQKILCCSSQPHADVSGTLGIPDESRRLLGKRVKLPALS